MGGDVNTAADFTERALYCLECSFAPTFNLALGTCRLDYNVFENRAIFIASFRHIGFVASRGCWRTALEYTKVLLSLSPEDDPLGAILMLDYYALRANANEYLRQVYAEWNSARQLDMLPNFAYSIAMAEFVLSTEPETDISNQSSKARPGQKAAPPKFSVTGTMETSNQLLQQAIIRFPEVVTLLAEKCGATLRPTIAKHAYFQSPSSANRSEKVVAIQASLRSYDS